MIVEIAKFEVSPEDVPAFVAATHVGERIFNEAEGCIGMEVRASASRSRGALG